MDKVELLDSLVIRPEWHGSEVLYLVWVLVGGVAMLDIDKSQTRPARDYLSCQLQVSQSSQPATCQGAGSVRSHDCHNKILSLTSSLSSKPQPSLCLQIINTRRD